MERVINCTLKEDLFKLQRAKTLPIVEKIKNIKSTKQELKKFGIALGIFFGLLGSFLLWRGKESSFDILILSGVFFFLGLIIPLLLKPLHKIWMTIAILLGWFMTRVILIISYYFVITPIGLLGRLFGMKFLDLQFKKDVDSHWIPRKDNIVKKNNYERQF